MADDKIIRDAQYRKGLSIAFFNATNSAIAIMTKQILPDDEMQAGIEFWRNWFLDSHKEYYSTVIANVGANYNAVTTIEKLKATKTLEELKSVWLSLSQDERRDEEILKVTNTLKQKYA